MCSKFNHTQCGRTCACAVACLHPHNSISNVVVSLTIHDNTYIYIYICKRCTKNMKLLRKVINIHVRIHVHLHIHVQVHVHVRVRVRVRVFVFVFVLACCCCCHCGLFWLFACCGCCGGGGRGREETNRTMSQLIPSAVSLRIAETEQLYQAQRMIGGIGNVLLSTYSQAENW